MSMKGFNTTKFENYLASLVKKDQGRIKSIQSKGISLAQADPFSAMFECASLGISMAEWLNTYESRRLRQKTLQNNIGKLHEVAISCFPGWELSSSTADVENSEQKIIAEIKNKHNTMNSSSALATYRKLEQLVDGAYEGYQSYVVQIIPKPTVKPYVTNFTPSDSSKKKAKNSPLREDIKIIDGESFYALINEGDTNTITEVYKLMMRCLKKIYGKQADCVTKDTTSIKFIESIRPSLR